MSNSKLVDYKRLSPNCTKPRNHKIDKIVIHHMAGKLSVEQCGAVFASPSRYASSNYGVGNDGRIGLYVDERNRSWATANAAIDNRAVTIEVANSKTGGNWPVSDKALKATIELCADICKRNGIKKLRYTGNKKGNLVMHCWYAATACPGPYLKSKFAYIAKQVNKKLADKEEVKTGLTSKLVPYKVKVTAKALNVRKGAGTKYDAVEVIRDKGVYTIIDQKGDWGRLKSKIGWINLKYTERV